MCIAILLLIIVNANIAFEIEVAQIKMLKSGPKALLKMKPIL